MGMSVDNTSGYMNEKTLLIEEVSKYCELKNGRRDNDIMLRCANNIISTTNNIRDFNPIRLKTWCGGKRADILGKWILERIDAKNRTAGATVYNKLVNILCNTDKKNISDKIECLENLYDLAMRYRLEEIDDADSICSSITSPPIKKKKITLAEAVFRYFRYTRNNPLTLLDHKAFQFVTLLSGLPISPEDKISLITSYCQGGKTFLVIPMMLIYLAMGFTPVIIVMDCCQKTQFITRLQPVLEELTEHLKLMNYPPEDIIIFKEYLYYDSKEPLLKTDKRLEKAMSGLSRRCVIVLKENTHLKRVNKYLKDTSRICLIPDEAHLTSRRVYVEEMSIFEDIESCMYHKEFNILKEKSEKCVLVSATLQGILHTDDTLMSDNVVYINPYQDLSTCRYKGIINSKLINIDTKNDKKNDILPKSLEKIIGELSLKQPISRNDYRHKKQDKHPVCLFVKVERNVEKQRSILYSFADKIHSDDINNAKWAIITFQGEGIRLYHESLVGQILIIEGVESQVLEHGEHFFKAGSLNITNIYQYLGERGVESFPRIMTICYDLGCEGMSFISDYNKPQNIHQTHGVFILPPTMNCSKVQQIMSRLFGNHGDDINFEIYATKNSNEKFILSFDLHDQEIRELVAVSQSGNNVICADFLNNRKMMKNRYPKKYTEFSRKVEPTPILMKNPNERKEKKMLKEGEITCIDLLSAMEPKKYEEIEKHFGKEEEDEINIEENGTIDGVKIENLHRWYQKDCKLLVSVMLKFLYAQNKAITIEEFRESIDYRGSNEKFMSNIFNGGSIKGQYGMLWNKNKDNIMINPKIKNYLSNL